MLLERDDLLGAAGSALGAVGRGAPALVVVEGEAGIGKTALLLALAERLAGDARVLTVRPAEHEAGYGLGVVRQLLAPMLAGMDDAQRTRAHELAGPAVAALGAGAAAGPVPPDPFAIEDGIWRLVADLAADGPLVLLVDDAHWADAASLRALGHVVRRLVELPVGVVLATRPDAPGAQADLLDALRLDPRAVVLRLPPLSPAAATTLAGDDAELGAACHRATGGNPLYLHEVLAEVGGRGPEAVRDASPATIARHVRRRAAGLGPDAVRLTEAMAIAGDGTPLAHAAAVADLPVGDARVHAQRLVALTVLAGADPVRFAHPVVLSAVRDTIGPGPEDALLRRAVAVLREAGAPVEQLAAYLLQLAPGLGADVGPLRAAADAAFGRGAPDAARDYLARALAEPPADEDRPFVLHALGTAEQLLADAAYDTHLGRAIELAPGAAERVAWTVQRAAGSAFEGRVPDAVTLLEEAVDADWATDEDALDVLRAHLLGMAWGSADGSVRAPEILAHFEAHPPRVPATARFVAGMRAGRMDRPAPEVVALAEAAWDEGEDASAIFGRLMAAGALIYTDRYDRARDRLERLHDLASGTANRVDLGAVQVMFGELAYARGDLRRSVEHADAGMLPFEHGPLSGTQAYVTAVKVRAQLELGHLDEAQASLDRAGPEPWLPTSHAHFFLRTAQGRLLLAQGHAADAADRFAAARRCLARFSGSIWSSLGFDGLAEEPAALLACGREDEARALVAEGLGRMDVSPPRGQALTLRAAALLGTDDAERAAQLQRATELLEGVGAQLELARTLVELGTLRRRTGQRAAAREPLGRAADLARDCGAAPLALRAREELAATGARPRRDRLSSGRGALTPSEARLARRAAQGRTNREIAQELFLSQKTVEMHLGRAYRKLGIGSRAELAAALEDPAATGDDELDAPA